VVKQKCVVDFVWDTEAACAISTVVDTNQVNLFFFFGDYFEVMKKILFLISLFVYRLAQ